MQTKKATKGQKSVRHSKAPTATKGQKSVKGLKAPKSTKSTKATKSLKFLQIGANNPDKGFCYKVPFFSSQGEKLGVVFDCVTSEIIPLSKDFSTFQFDATTTFRLEGSGDELTTHCVVTSRPRDPPADDDYNAMTACYNPNGVIGGKGVYEGASGSVKLVGIVNNSRFGETWLDFGIEWHIQLN